MPQLTYIITLLFGLSYFAKGQEVLDRTEYSKMIQHADTLYLNRQFTEAAHAYSNAFRFNNQGFILGDKYNAALAWAKAGNSDSALANLNLELIAGFYEVKKLKKEDAFKNIHKNKEWKKIVEQTKNNKQAEIVKLGPYKKVKPKLERILVSDQEHRKHYHQLMTQYGYETSEMKKLIQKMQQTDKKNFRYIKSVLDKYSWISYQTIGHNANSALFLVLQHADSINQETYLPMLRRAVKDKKAFGHELALLEDRVLIRKGQKQLYGSQIKCDNAGKNCFILPIEDEANVDKRRAEVGLQLLSEYVKFWNIIYKPAD